MPENIGYQFNRLYASPIETYRQVNTISQRNSIPPEIRWEGMECYVVSENQDYQLVGGIDNSNWVNAGETVSNPTTHFKGYFNATTLTPAISNLNGIEGDEYKVTNGGVNVDFGAGDVFLETDDIIIFYQSEWRVKVRPDSVGTLTANRALLSDASGKVAVSTVTNTELGYVSGVTSAIQTQLNAKVDSSNFNSLGDARYFLSTQIAYTTSIDNIQVSGHYRLETSATGVPAGESSTGSNLVHYQWNANVAKQVFYSFNTNNSYWRRKNSGTWGAWQKYLTDANYGLGYKVYTALISQSGTSAPTAIVLENTLGGTVVWSRSSGGVYHATLSGAFTINKTICQTSSTYGGLSNYGMVIPRITSTNFIEILSILPDTKTLTDGLLSLAPIEIRVYP